MNMLEKTVGELENLKVGDILDWYKFTEDLSLEEITEFQEDYKEYFAKTDGKVNGQATKLLEIIKEVDYTVIAEVFEPYNMSYCEEPEIVDETPVSSGILGLVGVRK